jgi:CrcB protein
MPPLFLVMIGGAIGAGFRYQTGAIVLRQLGPGFPYGTWIINLLGGMLMGLLAGWLTRTEIGGEPVRLFIGVGILGGFTTFSSFSLETFNMISCGQYGVATFYAVSSVIGSVLMLMLGLFLSRIFA